MIFFGKFSFSGFEVAFDLEELFIDFMEGFCWPEAVLFAAFFDDEGVKVENFLALLFGHSVFGKGFYLYENAEMAHKHEKNLYMILAALVELLEDFD